MSRRENKASKSLTLDNYDFYTKKSKELHAETRKKEKILELRDNPKALEKALNKLNLTDSEFINYSFKEISFEGTVFVLSNLAGTNFSDSVLNDCDFTFANLQNCSFENATLRNCIFRHTNLNGVDFSGAKTLFCDFTGSNINLIRKF